MPTNPRRVTDSKKVPAKKSAGQRPAISGDKLQNEADERRALYFQCERFLNGHGQRSASALLATIPDDTELDLYGNGGVVEELERDVAERLGAEAALFLVSGTMAQQAVLRIHADRRNCRSVVFHPASHLDMSEERAYERLHNLVAVTVGGAFQPLSLDGLEQVKEPVSSLLIELPQREFGGTLPSWDELVAMTSWARDRGAATHLDGARLWEAAPFYAASAGKSIKEIVALFDTAYVSFYKGLGGISGCCVVGDQATIDELKQWRIRHGGRLFGLWPYAASALSVLAQRGDSFTAYFERAQAIAKQLRAVEGVEVLPYPVQSPMMHLRVRGDQQKLQRRMLSIAKRDKVWMFGGFYATDGPNLQRLEFNVGDATMQLSLKEIRSLFERLVAPGR